MAKFWSGFRRQLQPQLAQPDSQSDCMARLRGEAVPVQVPPPPPPVQGPLMQRTAAELFTESERWKFDEEAYLEANPDVARVVANKGIASGWIHYVHHGKMEGRPLGTPSASKASLSTLSERHAGTGFLAPTDLRLTELTPKRVALVGSCFLENWKFHLANPSSCQCDLFLANNADQLPDFDPALYDFQVVQISLRSLVPDATFWMPLENEVAYQDAFTTACDRLSFQLRPRLELATKVGLLTFVVNYLVPQRNPIGVLHRRFDLRNPEYFIQQLNEFLESIVRECANAFVLDADRLAASVGRRFVQDDGIAIFAHNATWPTWGKVTDRIEAIPPLSEFYDVRRLELFRELVWAELLTMFRATRQTDAVKLVAIDLDDIMWQGVSGDMAEVSPDMLEGWPLGLAEALMYLKNRGVLLAIISKNEESRVRDLWDRMFVGRMHLSDFALVRINWAPKAENMAGILRDANLLPRNVVFIDDNPAEREAMRVAYSEMRILGKHVYYLRRILLWSAETQSASLTEESAWRTSMVQQQVVRDADRASLSRSEFLAQAAPKVSVSRIESTNHPQFSRVYELINRTNQFNTTGQRRAVSALVELLDRGGSIFVFEVSDRYTAYGLVGVVLVEGVTILQWVMSCRALGLDVEQFVMKKVVESLRAEGATKVVGLLMETDANFPCRDLFAKTGFVAEPDGSAWTLNGDVICNDTHISESL